MISPVNFAFCASATAALFPLGLLVVIDYLSRTETEHAALFYSQSWTCFASICYQSKLIFRRITGEGAGGLLLLISAETEQGEEDPGQLANSKAAIDRFLLHFFQTFGDATASQLSLSDSINKWESAKRWLQWAAPARSTRLQRLSSRCSESPMSKCRLWFHWREDLAKYLKVPCYTSHSDLSSWTAVKQPSAAKHQRNLHKIAHLSLCWQHSIKTPCF